MRSLVSDLSRHNPTPVARALHWALPWSRRGYPGFHRGVTEIIEHWVTPTAVQHWRRGRRRMQIKDAVRLQQYVANRVAEGQDILAELDGYIAMRLREPKRLHGCVVQEDGLDRRGRWEWRG
jgi:hypothetical protein